MSQTLNDLPLGIYNNLVWENEFDWTPMAQSSYYGVTGQFVLQHGQKIGGRPITLSGDALYRAGLDALFALLTEADPMTLDLDGRQLTVWWDHGNQPIQSSQIPTAVGMTAPWDESQALYEITLHLLTAE